MRWLRFNVFKYVAFVKVKMAEWLCNEVKASRVRHAWVRKYCR